MKVLRKYADRGYGILLSIHQPRVGVFELLDRVLLLQRGQIIYSGTPYGAQSYFDTLRIVLPLRENPADSLLDAFEDVQTLNRAFTACADIETNTSHTINQLTPPHTTEHTFATNRPVSLLQHLYIQIRVLLLLLVRLCYRDINIVIFPTAMIAGVTLLLVAIFWNIFRPALVTRIYTASYAFHQIGTIADIVFKSYAWLYTAEYPRFSSEIEDRRMHSLTVSLWWLLLTAVRSASFTLVSCAVAYWALKFSDGSVLHFSEFLLGSWLTAMLSALVTLSVTALCLNEVVGSGVAMIYVMYGVLYRQSVSVELMPRFMRWLLQLSPHRHQTVFLWRTQALDTTFQCPQTDSNSSILLTTFNCPVTGRTYADYLSYDNSTSRALGLLFMWFVFWALLVVMVICWRQYLTALWKKLTSKNQNYSHANIPRVTSVILLPKQSIRLPSAQFVSLLLKNVTYKIDNHTILSDINFSAQSGQLIAVMGASGSGKTTLLNIMAGKAMPGVFTGQLLLHDRIMNCGLAEVINFDDSLASVLGVCACILRVLFCVCVCKCVHGCVHACTCVSFCACACICLCF